MQRKKRETHGSDRSAKAWPQIQLHVVVSVRTILFSLLVWALATLPVAAGFNNCGEGFCGGGAGGIPAVKNAGSLRVTEQRDVASATAKALSSVAASPTEQGDTLAAAGVSSAPISDPLPASRRTNWTYTGVPGGIPHRTTICATFSAGATAASINSAITSCNNGVVYLNAGTYTSTALGGAINIRANNVTLRGAGTSTILQGANIINLGYGNNYADGTAITAGGTKGTNTITVASTSNLSVGTMIELDRADDTMLIPAGSPQETSGRNVTQVNMITGVSGNTLTLRNPLFTDFTAVTTAKVKNYFDFTQKSGVEDMYLDHSGFGAGQYNFQIEYCDQCWIKGVESGFATGYHFIVCCGTLNFEFRDNFVHDGGVGPNNSGLNMYGSYTYGGDSSTKIENNIFNNNFPSIEINNSSSGMYIGYNFEYGTAPQGGYLVTWTLDNGHAPFNIMNLFEGNIGEMIGADGWFGGSGLTVFVRNYSRGYNLNGAAGDSIKLKRLNYQYSIIGNVLGSTAQTPASYQTGCDVPNIYQLGYPNIGNCELTDYTPAPWSPPGGYPDAGVASSLLRWGNYDYYNHATQWNPAEIPSDVAVPSSETIPQSYYYSSTPAWWNAGIPWPPIGPDVTGGNGDTSGHVNKTPAQLCWENSNLLNGGAFSRTACYPNS